LDPADFGPLETIMRHAIAIALLLPVAGVIAQDKAPSDTPPSKKGDKIAIYGCLKGSALEATDVGGSEDVSPVTQGMTFRLTGDKALLKEMKEKHDKKVVEVRGVLKSDLLPASWGERTVGNTRISIGAPTTGSASANDEAKRSVPVVEVKSYEGRDISCGR
jgi:hypothetical protein